MAASNVGSIKKHFARLKDPRVRGRTKHLLGDIIFIAICGVIANCNDWHDIVLFAKEREAWFKRYLRLPNGVPSHDTFERVFTILDEQAFQRCCLLWLREVSELVGVKHIAIDGKTLRGSARSGLRALHLVSAWATDAHLTLGQVAVAGKSNEITAIPVLLELLDLKGALVTIDAMGCQKEIAAKIVAGGGDYVLTVKANQERLLEDIQATVEKALDGKLLADTVEEYATRTIEHGRHEERFYVVIHSIDDIRDREAWADLKTVGMCSYERTEKGQTITEVRYFISSRKIKGRKCDQVMRGHWGIENNLHWQLDVSFDEDDSRIHQPQRATAFAMLRKIALCLLKQHPAQHSIAKKRLAAALNPAFLAKILAGANNVEEI